MRFPGSMVRWMAPSPEKAVPRTREEILDPTWLHAALDDIEEGDTIVGVETTGTSKTRLEKLRFAVTVEGSGGPSSRRLLCQGQPRWLRQ